MDFEIIGLDRKIKTPCRLVVNIPKPLLIEMKRRALDRNIALRTWVLRAIFEAIKEEKKYE